MAYRWNGMDDAGQSVMYDWWDQITGWAFDAITAGGVVFVHCYLQRPQTPPPPLQEIRSRLPLLRA